jgi:hypothetical protein
MSCRKFLQWFFVVGGCVGIASAFSSSTQSRRRLKYTLLEVCDSSTHAATFSFAATIVSAAIFAASPVLASEIGMEVEAPTFTTGETVEVRYCYGRDG